jgi:hypothetical protein
MYGWLKGTRVAKKGGLAKTATKFKAAFTMYSFGSTALISRNTTCSVIHLIIINTESYEPQITYALILFSTMSL